MTRGEKRRGETRRDKARRDETRRGATRRDETRRDETRPAPPLTRRANDASSDDAARRDFLTRLGRARSRRLAGTPAASGGRWRRGRRRCRRDEAGRGGEKEYACSHGCTISARRQEGKRGEERHARGREAVSDRPSLPSFSVPLRARSLTLRRRRAAISPPSRPRRVTERSLGRLIDVASRHVTAVLVLLLLLRGAPRAPPRAGRARPRAARRRRRQRRRGAV